jgi:parvulin-like peptidyl-prolyl isomerase
MKRTLYCSVGIFLCSSFALSAETEIAKVNSTVISVKEFEKKYEESLKYLQTKPPTRATVLDELIKRELVVQEARKLGLERDPEVVDRMNTALFYAMIDRQLGKEFEKIQISESETRDYYEKNPEIRVSHIFVALAPNASQVDGQKAMAKIKLIQDQHLRPGKMSFAEVAQKYSEGSAAAVGGDLDFQSRDRLPDPKIYDIALALKTPGKVSEIVRSQFGLHVVRLTAIRPWEETDKSAARRRLYDERKNSLFEKYVAGLRSKARVNIQTGLLNR